MANPFGPNFPFNDSSFSNWVTNLTDTITTAVESGTIIEENNGVQIYIPEITTNSNNVVDNRRSMTIGSDVYIGGSVNDVQQIVPARDFMTSSRQLWNGITMPVCTVIRMIPKPILAIMILAVGFECCRFVTRNKYEIRIYNFIENHPGWSMVIGCFTFMVGKSTVKYLLSDSKF